MHKVTLKIFLFILLGCNPVDQEKELEAYEQQLNKEAEKTIDAAYMVIKQRCDSLLKQKRTLNDSIYRSENKAKRKVRR